MLYQSVLYRMKEFYACFCMQSELLDQGGKDLCRVAYHAVVGVLEDLGGLILVDADDGPALTDAADILGGAGYAHVDKDPRLNGLSAGADHGGLIGDPPGIDQGSGPGKGSAKLFCQVGDTLPGGVGGGASSCGHNYLGFGDIVFGLSCGLKAKELFTGFGGAKECGISAHDLNVCRSRNFCVQDAGPYGCHDGAGIRDIDLTDHLAAEGWHHAVQPLAVPAEVYAVGRKTGL